MKHYILTAFMFVLAAGSVPADPGVVDTILAGYRQITDRPQARQRRFIGERSGATTIVTFGTAGDQPLPGAYVR